MSALGDARFRRLLVGGSVSSVLYLVPLLPASCAALAVFGIAVPLNSVSVRVATQRHTPAYLQGRTIAASDMATNLAQTLSITIGAALIGILGYRPLLVIVAVVGTLAAIPVLARPAPSSLARPIVDSGICSDSAGRRLMAPVLYVIACGGPPARQLPDFVRFAQAADWDVCVIATPDGTKFMDAPRLAELTGHPVRVTYKNPDEPDVLPSADAFVIAPATFNLVNKLAHGISDTLALGLVNEAVGLDLPIVAVPWPNAALARHPVFQRSVAALRDWGMTVILDTARLPDAGREPAVFPWDDLRGELPRLRAAVAGASR